MLDLDLFRVVEDIAAKVPVKKLIEVGHKPLRLHCPLPWGVHPLQLVTKVAHFRGNIADVFIKFLEVLESHL